jgi:hypothetical protein
VRCPPDSRLTSPWRRTACSMSSRRKTSGSPAVLAGTTFGHRPPGRAALSKANLTGLMSNAGLRGICEATRLCPALAHTWRRAVVPEHDHPSSARQSISPCQSCLWRRSIRPTRRQLWRCGERRLNILRADEVWSAAQFRQTTGVGQKQTCHPCLVVVRFAPENRHSCSWPGSSASCHKRP